MKSIQNNLILKSLSFFAQLAMVVLFLYGSYAVHTLFSSEQVSGENLEALAIETTNASRSSYDSTESYIDSSGTALEPQ